MKRYCILAFAFACTTQVFASEVYVSDPPHTQAYFETGHLGISWVRGRFSDVNAKILLDRAAKQGAIEAVIKTASVDTAHEARDKHVKSPDYLDVDKFPTMAFKATNLKFDGEKLVGADGELTMMGVTRPVSLQIPYFHCIQHPANKRDMCGADVRTLIKRSEWGLKRGANNAMGDEVKISIQIEAYRQQ